MLLLIHRLLLLPLFIGILCLVIVLSFSTLCHQPYGEERVEFFTIIIVLMS